MKQFNQFNIDLRTHCVRLVVRRLGQLKSTLWVKDAGTYREDAFYSQVHIATTMAEDQLEAWMDWVNAGAAARHRKVGRGPGALSIDYIGITELTPHVDICRTNDWLDIWRAEGLVQ